MIAASFFLISSRVLLKDDKALIVSDQQSLLVYTPSQKTTMTQILVGLGGRKPGGVACDYNGNILAAYSEVVVKITPNGKLSVVVRGDPTKNQYVGLAIPFASSDPNAPLYVADAQARQVLRITRDGKIHPIARAFSSPCGLSDDAAGNVLVADRGSDEIVAIDKNQDTTVIAKGNGVWNHPTGVCLDPNGNLHIRTTSPSGYYVKTRSGWLTAPREKSNDKFECISLVYLNQYESGILESDPTNTPVLGMRRIDRHGQTFPYGPKFIAPVSACLIPGYGPYIGLPLNLSKELSK
jgi:DNA-binding beta-propeller fold protein YncE